MRMPYARLNYRGNRPMSSKCGMFVNVKFIHKIMHHMNEFDAYPYAAGTVVGNEEIPSGGGGGGGTGMDFL